MKKMKKSLTLVLTLIFSATTTITYAQKPEVITTNKEGWHKIGDARVDFKSDKDQFIVLGKDRFKAIQVKVKDAPVRINDLQIYYQGGSKEDVSVATDMAAGSESQVINLKNNSAEIKKVVFVYHTVANSHADKAVVELWGLK